MAISGEERAFRATRLGSSDAPRLMSGAWRALWAEKTGRAAAPESFTAHLSDKAPFQHGVQCCGGEVTVLLEPLAVVPAVAVFGVGHVGLELGRVLARHDLELHLVDSRPEHVSAEALAPLDQTKARLKQTLEALIPA